MSKKTSEVYDASSIGLLEGLEPVKHRPGMYTKTENQNHIMQEIVDNSFDEALAGHADKLWIEVHDDGSFSVEDNGRGIPVDMHETKNKPAIEIIFTVLHAGGKFNNNGENSAYKQSGGLHGVGASVTNALSKRFEATVWRNGYEYSIAFEHGDLVQPLEKKKCSPEDKNKRGTRIQAWPEAKYFMNPHVEANFIEKFVKQKTILAKNVEVSWSRPDKPTQVWKFEEGATQYLKEEVADDENWVTPILSVPLFFTEERDPFHVGEGLDLAIGFTAEGRAVKNSFANLIPTTNGGQHEKGLRSGLFEAFKNVAERFKWLPAGLKVEADDLLVRANFVLSVFLQDPAFQGQTKEELTTPNANKMVNFLVKDAFELWLNDNPAVGKTVADLVAEEAIRRQKSNIKVERKKGNSASVLPGKLADCENKNPVEGELFLVEGDSAGGSSKQGRQRSFQAILPLRGKLLNTWEVATEKLNVSETINNISVAIGVEPHSEKTKHSVDMSKLRYHKVIVLADADVDGLHIQVLLGTLFYKHFPAVIDAGHLYFAQPPLFRLDAPPKKGSKKGDSRKMYLMSTNSLEKNLKLLEKEGVDLTKVKTTRFKGLGEMNPEQLWETTLDPETRIMLKASYKDFSTTNDVFEMMMHKKKTTERKEWLERDGHTVSES